MLAALNGADPFPELNCIEDMRVTMPETDNVTEKAAVLVAFSALAMACKSTQVCGMLAARATAADVASPVHKTRVEHACSCIVLAEGMACMHTCIY